MENSKVITENVFLNSDENVRKSIIILKIAELVRNDILSSVQKEAIVHLQNGQK